MHAHLLQGCSEKTDLVMAKYSDNLVTIARPVS